MMQVLLIEYQYQNCEYDRFDEEKIILKITNKVNKDILLSFKEELWYDEKCINCNLENENEFLKALIFWQMKSNQVHVKEMTDSLFFQSLLKRLIDMPGVNKIVELTKFELKKINISLSKSLNK